MHTVDQKKKKDKRKKEKEKGQMIYQPDKEKIGKLRALKKCSLGWRDGSTVKSIDCF